MGSVAFPGIKSGWFLKLALRTVTGFIPEPPPSLTIGSRPIATNCLTVLLELFSKTELQPPGESPSGISVRFHVLRGGLAARPLARLQQCSAQTRHGGCF